MAIDKFLGINNVAPRTRLFKGELNAATDVDVTTTGSLTARRGRTLLRAGAAHSIFEAPFGVFVVQDNDLVLLTSSGSFIRTVHESVGPDRLWYVLLPDGRVGFSNDLVNGLATATATTSWGIEPPVDPGTGIAGDVPYQITYVRLSDKAESPPTYGQAIDPAEAVIGLPVKPGYAINLYLAPAGQMYLAGTTLTDTIWPGPATGPAYHSAPVGLPPAGKLLTTWGARVLIAEGRTLWATRPFQPELCDLTRDYLMFEDEITLVYPVQQAGIFIGTKNGLMFAAGNTLGELKLQTVATGPVILGSGAEVELQYFDEKTRPNGYLQGALCLIDGYVHLLYGAGQVIPLSVFRYRTDAVEVLVTTRVRGGMLQYLAAPV